ncbi:B-box zinc finger protein [Wenzhouxiangella sediminis]|uniref:B box-type domain-containing protein n=1 Tax=Wenzhouxiangella sediminis TaxID=1792836 RepID=A0A3E1KBF4_9GAMM|nr:B-box zinc finger protein [Wenzhouxiangella sediminis]RFF31945.1 hypothetical protein DZC52_02845 [Wenzhouxiangella sediminis]
MKHPKPSSCRFHAQSPTRWFCNDCSLPLCTSCKPYAEQLPLQVDCPLCGQAMVELQPDAENATSFRDSLKAGAAVPGLLVAACTALVGAAGFTSIAGLLLALPLATLLLAMMITLAQRAGEGRSNAPTLAELIDIDQLEYSLHLLPLGLPHAGILLLGAASGSAALLFTAALLVAILLPLSLMAAVSQETPRASIDPRELTRVARITREHYVPVALGAAGLTILAASTLHFSAAPPLVSATVAFITTWFALAASFRLGAILRTHRRMLDYPAGVAPIDRPRRPDAAVYEPAMMAADSESLLREKRTHDARLLLGRALTRFPDDARLNEQFDRLVAETARPREFRSHLERRMQRLFRSGSTAAATALWQRYSPQLENWVPRVSETRYRLALELDEAGDHQTAFRLLIGLSPNDSRFRHVAEAWMEAARILEQRLDDPARAAELRRIVRERYPEKARKWDRHWLHDSRAVSSPTGTRQARAASA